jgi:hypothetical protein
LGADREAQRQVLAGKYDASPAHLPSAARLAQILRADAVLKSGEGASHPQIHVWAQAIKEGRRREVADLDPEYVQNAVSAALGGPTRAEQLLSSPFVHSLIERHRSTVETIHRQLHHVEKQVRDGGAGMRARTRISSSSGATSAPSAPVSLPSSGYASASSLPVSASSGVSRAERAERMQSRSYEPELARMLAGNEEPHLAMTAMDEGERASREIRESASGPRSRADRMPALARERGNDRRLLANFPQGPALERASMESASASRHEPAASISAAPVSAARPAQAVNAPVQAQAQHKLELTGRLTLMGNGGQPLGTAEFDAEAGR